MSGECVSPADSLLKPEHEQWLDLLMEKFEKKDDNGNIVENGALKKVLLGGTPEDATKDLFYDWVQKVTGFHPLHDKEAFLADPGHLHRLFRLASRAERQYMHALKAEGDSFERIKAVTMRMLATPEAFMSRYHLGGGNVDTDVHFQLSVLESRRNGMEERAAQRLKSIWKRLEALTGVSTRKMSERLSTLEDEIAMEPDEKLRSAKIEHRSRLLAGEVVEGEDASLFRAARIARDFVLALNGLQMNENGELFPLPKTKGQTFDPRSADLENPDKTVGVDWDKFQRQTLKIWQKEGLVTLGKDGLPISTRATAVLVDVINSTRELTNDFSEMVQEAVAAQRESMVLLLSGPKGRLTPEAAQAWVDKNITFSPEEHYFPMVAIRRLGAYDRLMEVAKHSKFNGDESIKELEAALLNESNELALAGAHSAQFLKERTSNQFNVEQFSVDAIRLLGAHTQAVIDHWQMNKMSQVINRHITGLWSIRHTLDPKERVLFEKHLKGMSHYLIDLAKAADTMPGASIMRDTVRTMVAWKAMLTMGFPNTSTPFVNLVEAFAHGTVARLATENPETSPKGEQLVLEAYSQENPSLFNEMSLGIEFSDRKRMMDLAKALGSSVRGKRWIEVEDGRVELEGARWHEKLADGSTELASRLLFMQRGVENFNRKKAWKLGAQLEYEAIAKKFENDIKQSKGERLSDNMLESMGLTREMVRKDPEGAWKKFAMSRVRKAGYDFVFRTQFNYNLMNRALWERPGAATGWMRVFTMYQHFPASYLASALKSYELFRSEMAVKGMAGMKGSTLQRESAPTQLDNSALYRASMMGAFLVSAAARNISGFSFNLFQNPGVDLVIDFLLDMVDGDDDESRVKSRFEEGLWQKGVVSQFTGPYYQDTMDFISLVAMHGGLNEGDLPLGLQKALQNTIGFRIGDTLNDYGTRDVMQTEAYSGRPERGFMQDMFHLANEAFGLGGWSGGTKMARGYALYSPDGYRKVFGPDGLDAARLIAEQLDPPGKNLKIKKQDLGKMIMPIGGVSYQDPEARDRVRRDGRS